MLPGINLRDWSKEKGSRRKRGIGREGRINGGRGEVEMNGKEKRKKWRTLGSLG